MPAPALSLRAVTKRYGDLTAVADLSLDVEPGEILGFLGPNGAGKTTTIRLLTGFLRPTSGTVQLLGHDLNDGRAAMAARARLGFVPDVAGLDTTATGRGLLDDLAALQGRPPVERERIIAALDLNPGDLRRPMGRLSRGTRQKINIVQGLQHRPDVLVLDEPTEGLDPLAKRALFDLLAEARGRGATIFFSSHVLGEVEELCDRVALIRGGRLVAVDAVNRLRAHLQRRVSLVLAPDTGAEGIAARLGSTAGAGAVVERDGRWEFLADDLQAVLRLLAELPVADVIIQPPSLEEVFLSYYRPEAGSGDGLE
jgi:ABC-2 type transport system ATP-binding protein